MVRGSTGGLRSGSVKNSNCCLISRCNLATLQCLPPGRSFPPIGQILGLCSPVFNGRLLWVAAREASSHDCTLCRIRMCNSPAEKRTNLVSNSFLGTEPPLPQFRGGLSATRRFVQQSMSRAEVVRGVPSCDRSTGCPKTFLMNSASISDPIKLAHVLRPVLPRLSCWLTSRCRRSWHLCESKFPTSTFSHEFRQSVFRLCTPLLLTATGLSACNCPRSTRKARKKI